MSLKLEVDDVTNEELAASLGETTGRRMAHQHLECIRMHLDEGEND